MKRISTLLFAAVLLASCSDEIAEWKVQARNRHAVLGEWTLDSIQIGGGPRLYASENKKLAGYKLWFKWNDMTQFPQPPYKGNGVRYEPDSYFFGTRVETYFEWSLDESGAATFWIGTNKIVGDVFLNNARFIQIRDPRKPQEQDQTIWMHRVAEGTDMNGVAPR